MSRTFILVASSWLLGACVVDEIALTDHEQSVTLPNGISPNGISPNGISPNGISPNGISPNVVTLNGISPNGISPDGTPIAIAVAGAPLAGAELIGSTWTGRLSTGASVALRIDDAARGTGASADMWWYRWSVSADGSWRPLCVDAAGAPLFADTVHGTWSYAEGVPGGGAYDPDAPEFTIACRGSAIAKCVELGYKPWLDRAREVATCVRALRGDYCGDGRPHTVDGTLVNLYDAAGIQRDDAAWDIEAAWGPDGAVCVSTKKATRFDQVAGDRPACFPRTLKPRRACGESFSGEVVIVTELAPR